MLWGGGNERNKICTYVLGGILYTRHACLQAHTKKASLYHHTVQISLTYRDIIMVHIEVMNFDSNVARAVVNCREVRIREERGKERKQNVRNDKASVSQGRVKYWWAHSTLHKDDTPCGDKEYYSDRGRGRTDSFPSSSING